MTGPERRMQHRVGEVAGDGRDADRSAGAEHRGDVRIERIEVGRQQAAGTPNARPIGSVSA